MNINLPLTNKQYNTKKELTSKFFDRYAERLKLWSEGDEGRMPLTMAIGWRQSRVAETAIMSVRCRLSDCIVVTRIDFWSLSSMVCSPYDDGVDGRLICVDHHGVVDLILLMLPANDWSSIGWKSLSSYLNLIVMACVYLKKKKKKKNMISTTNY